MIPKAIDRILLNQMPPAIAMHYRAYKLWRWAEPEIRALRALCDRRKVSIDVGAHCGRYAYFIRHFSKRCVAIEPNPDARRLFRRNLGRSCELVPYAISEHDKGRSMLRIPQIQGGFASALGTIEPANLLGGHFEQIGVETRTLDSLEIHNVGFVKIDVEGHELSVLRGAQGILRAYPNLMIEIENRHRPNAIDTTFEFMGRLGYLGFFISDGRLLSVRDFSPARHQDVSRICMAGYVNNFIFTRRLTTINALSKTFNISA